MIEFFLPMEKIPTTTHQQKKVNVRNGKPVFYEPVECKMQEQNLKVCLRVTFPQIKYKAAFVYRQVVLLDGKRSIRRAV